jgi:predicted transcriptional regulator
MTKSTLIHLSRRERQIMDILFQRGSSTVNDVMQALPDPPSYSAVRAMLRVLEIKGHVKHTQQGPRYIYTPCISLEKAKRSAAKHLVQTFFDGSAERAVATLIDVSKTELSQKDLDRLAELIKQAKQEGR